MVENHVDWMSIRQGAFKERAAFHTRKFPATGLEILAEYNTRK